MKDCVRFIRSVGTFLRAEKRGASMIEYALLVGLIAVVSIAAVTAVGTSLQSQFSQISGAL